MKKVITFLSITLCAVALYAQTPQAFNYQAVARTTGGALLQNSSVAIRVTIHDNSETGPILYQERDTATTNLYGLFTCKAGNGAVLQGAFALIDWASGPKFMQVELDPTC